LRAAIEQSKDYIQSETLAIELSLKPVDGAVPVTLRVAEFELTLYVKVVPKKQE